MRVSMIAYAPAGPMMPGGLGATVGSRPLQVKAAPRQPSPCGDIVDRTGCATILRAARTGVTRPLVVCARADLPRRVRQPISVSMMFAVIRTGGKQYKVAADDVISVEKLAGDPGATIELGEVLMLGDGATVSTGAPLVAGASVSATLVE